MKKKNNENINKMLNSSNNTYEDKLALLKYLMKNNSDTVSGAVVNVLKKK